MIRQRKTALPLMAVIILLLPAAIQGCKDDELQDTLPFTKFPLEVGRKWTYRTILTSDVLSPAQIDLTWEVVRTEMLNGRLNYVIRKTQTQGDNTFIFESYYTEDSIGLWYPASTGTAGTVPFFKKEALACFDSFLHPPLLKAEDDTFFQDSLLLFDEPLLNLKYPIALGDEWVFINYSGSSETAIRKYEGTAVVTLPAGVFNTVFMSTTLTIDSNTRWIQFFSNDGLIREINTGITSDSNGIGSGPYELVTELISVN